MANDAETVAVIDSAVEILNENFVASTDTGAGTGASSNFPLHVVSNATYKFHYEIDCVKVGNSINVVDLVSVLFYVLNSNFLILFIFLAAIHRKSVKV